MGGNTGKMTGNVSLPAMGWGTFRVTLNSYPAAGSGLQRPEPSRVTAEYGVGLTLERPEMLAMVSGNQVELIMDWYTLSDYYTQEYLPEMKFTFYADPECQTEVRSETVDLEQLADTVYRHPMGYNWGSSYSEPLPRYYHSNGELTGFGPIGLLLPVQYFPVHDGTRYILCHLSGAVQAGIYQRFRSEHACEDCDYGCGTQCGIRYRMYGTVDRSGNVRHPEYKGRCAVRACGLLW